LAVNGALIAAASGIGGGLPNPPYRFERWTRMSPNQNPSEDAVLRVSRELYARLREHCDRLGIRFVDFVEDAL
jgi:hypothetical protein